MHAPDVKDLVISDTGGWMTTSNFSPAVGRTHPGLAYFCPLNQLIVVAKRDKLHEVMGTIDDGYTIFNTDGQKVFLAIQENKCGLYNIKIFNMYGNEVIHLRKRFKMCYNKARIWAPPGNFLGSVEEGLSRCSCVKRFVVKDSLKKAVLTIKRRKIPFQYDYEIFSDGVRVGLLTNRWRFTNILNVKGIGVSFPIFMSVEYKIMTLCACFFIGCLKY